MTEDFKVKVSRMYHFSEISKTEIGKRLGISRFRVSRLLEQARQEGIVQINIVEPAESYAEIEDQLEKRFGLYHAVVVGSGDLTDPSVMSAIGKAGAERLVNLLSDGDILGITWGATVNEVVKALPPRVDKRIEVVQTLGGLNQMAINVNVIEMVSRVAGIYTAKSHVLYAPAIVNNRTTRDALMADNSIHPTIEMIDKVTVALSGIGAFSSRVVSNLLKTGSFDDDDLARLRTRKAVGDIFAHFFDIHGRICDPDLDQRIVGMRIDQLKKVRYSIGVAGGIHKSLAILGALRGKLINILITDYETAYDILEKDTLLPG